jgi:hypothetical protein
VIGHSAFDNHEEYLELYGVESHIPKMQPPRISAQRLLPDAIKTRLGIAPHAIPTDMQQSP